MENFEINQKIKLIESKEIILSKMTLDSNNNVLIDNKPASGENLVFDTLIDLETYANSITDNIGQVCGVANTTDNTVKIYKVNIDKTVSELGSSSGESVDLTAIKGDIIPTTNGTQNIGSPTNRFGTIYVNEAKLSTNTLYIGDTPVLGTTQDTIMVKADLDQSLTVKTSGVGTTKVISQSNVELSTSGMNANINVQATGSGANANLSATNQVNLTAPNININGNTTVDNLTVRGNVSVQGATFDVEATTIRVEDNIIELNKNEVGYGVTAGRSGLKINRGDADDYLIVFDETDDNVKVGTDSTLKILSTKDYVDNQDANKVDKVTGKSLMLDTEITRLASVTNLAYSEFVI